MDKKKITYTVDMFRSTLKLPVETLENSFIAPATPKFIHPFLKIVGYQGNVDKKKHVIQYPCFTKHIVNDPMQKFDSIPMRLKEDYHSIKDDIPLEYKEYEKVFIREDIKKIVDGEEEESYASEFANYVFLNDEKDSGTRLEPRSYKENPKTVDDDDGDVEERKDDKKDDNNDDDDNDDHTDHTLVRTQVTRS
nr:hypothetical protein [Tanacetum cinerariifolium]